MNSITASWLPSRSRYPVPFDGAGSSPVGAPRSTDSGTRRDPGSGPQRHPDRFLAPEEAYAEMTGQPPMESGLLEISGSAPASEGPGPVRVGPARYASARDGAHRTRPIRRGRTGRCSGRGRRTWRCRGPGLPAAWPWTRPVAPSTRCRFRGPLAGAPVGGSARPADRVRAREYGDRVRPLAPSGTRALRRAAEARRGAARAPARTAGHRPAPAAPKPAPGRKHGRPDRLVSPPHRLDVRGRAVAAHPPDRRHRGHSPAVDAGPRASAVVERAGPTLLPGVRADDGGRPARCRPRGRHHGAGPPRPRPGPT